MAGLPLRLFVRGELGAPHPFFLAELSGRYVLDIVLWEIADRNALSVGYDTERVEIEVEVVESVLFAVVRQVLDICRVMCRKNCSSMSSILHGSLTSTSVECKFL